MNVADQIRAVQGRLESPARSGVRSEPARSGTSVAESGSSAVQSAPSNSADDRGQAPARTPAGGFYISPNLSFDARASTVIFQIRDAVSGDVTRQFPAEAAVERYRRDPSQQPFVLPAPAAGDDEAPAPRINNRDTPDPAEIELATGPTAELEGQGPAPAGGDRSAASGLASNQAAPSISPQSAPVDILT